MSTLNTNFTISSGTIVKGILIIGLFWAAYLLRDVILILLTSVVIASGIEPITKWFSRYKVPRIISVLIVYFIASVTLVGLIVFFLPLFISEVSRLSVDLPAQIESLSLGEVIPSSIQNSSGGFDGVVGELRNTLNQLSSGFLQTISIVFGGVTSFILIFVISFYLAVQENGIENFLRVVTPLKKEKYVIDLWRRSQEKIGLWLQGQFVLAVIVGVLVFLGLAVLGVKYALSLAVLAMFFELIPIFGPILAAIPGVAFAFNQSVPLGFMVLGWYVIVQQLENHLIYPTVVNRIVGVPSLLVILALLAGATLAGFLGFILAVPVAAILVEIFNDMETEKLESLAKRSKV